LSAEKLKLFRRLRRLIPIATVTSVEEDILFSYDTGGVELHFLNDFFISQIASISIS